MKFILLSLVFVFGVSLAKVQNDYYYYPDPLPVDYHYYVEYQIPVETPEYSVYYDEQLIQSDEHKSAFDEHKSARSESPVALRAYRRQN